MRYAIIDADGWVLNVALWDGATPWSPGEGLSAVPVPDGLPVDAGWRYEAGAFAPPADAG